MKRLFICFITMLFVTCTPEDKKVPEDILSIDKMKVIVWDMMQAGAYESFLVEKDTASKNLNTTYLTAVLKLHKINKADFFKSFKFYQSHPLLNKQLFDSLGSYSQRQRVQMYKRYQ